MCHKRGGSSWRMNALMCNRNTKMMGSASCCVGGLGREEVSIISRGGALSDSGEADLGEGCGGVRGGGFPERNAAAAAAAVGSRRAGNRETARSAH